MNINNLLKQAFFVCLMANILAACTNPKQEKEELNLDKPISSDSIMVSDLNSEQFLREIFQNQGLVRGVTFGDTIDSVKKRMTAQPFEEEPSHIGYSVETPQMETADILYFRDSFNKVVGIHVDIFLNNEESFKAMNASLVNYFTTMYGEPVRPKELQWNLPKKGTVKVTPVNKQFDHGYEIEFSL